MSLLLIVDKGDAPLGDAGLFRTDELKLTRELVLAVMNKFGFSHTGEEDDLEIGLHEDSQEPYATVWDMGDTDLRVIMWSGDDVQIVDALSKIELPEKDLKSDGSC